MRQILIIDDDRNHLKVIKGLLERKGFVIFTASDVDFALPIIEQNDLALVITDLKMPGKSGMDLLVMSRQLKPTVPVIMITGHGDIETAVAAIKSGAYDYITKPVDEHELLNVVRKALAESKKNRELVSSYFDTEVRFLPDVIGTAPAMEQIQQTVRKIAPTDSTVLITGETGVGKELIAKAIHSASNRRDQPFVKVNCAAIPETLAESELFGYERGAFTGAVTSKPGRFELAHLGTIFLDEIGDMQHLLQSRLLSVLQDKTIERVGGVKTVKVDVRIISATNKDLLSSVQSGKFRSDLFYRLNVVPIHIPPLRERKDDIVSLVDYFLKKLAARHGKQICTVRPETMTALLCHDWPGNVRELENTVERMVLMSETDVIGPDLLPPELHGTAARSRPSAFKDRVDDIVCTSEKQMIVDALNKTNQNRTKAADLLGISRRTLQNKIKEYGL